MTSLPLIIGHRGASAHAPENTLASFRLALDHGADGVEFDVRLSKDNIPVVIHDETLARTASRRDRVSEMTALELAALDAGSWFNRRYPAKAVPEFCKERIPTLEQVLALLGECKGPIFVELKAENEDPTALAHAVCGVLSRSPGHDRFIVKSFDLAAIGHVRNLAPEITTSALFSPHVRNIIRRPGRLLAVARQAGAHEVSLHRALLSRRLARSASELGIPLTVWTADDPKWINRCRERGVHNLITNEPGMMKRHRDRSDVLENKEKEAFLASERHSA